MYRESESEFDEEADDDEPSSDVAAAQSTPHRQLASALGGTLVRMSSSRPWSSGTVFRVGGSTSYPSQIVDNLTPELEDLAITEAPPGDDFDSLASELEDLAIIVAPHGEDFEMGGCEGIFGT